MATVYSLVCWGGRTGKTVTLTIASPCVVTSTNHGLRDGTGLVFSTTGALPTGITAGTTYYARSTAANTFNLYDTEAHAKDTANTTGRINTSGTQSGTQTAKSRLMLDYFDQYPGRWGDAGSERCYDSLQTFQSTRVSNANQYIAEVCELGEAFDDYYTSMLTLNIPASEVLICPKIDGVKTTAWHGGIYGAGYRGMLKAELYDAALKITGVYHTVRDISFCLIGNNCDGVQLYGIFNDLLNAFIYRIAGSGQVGLAVFGTAAKAINCVVVGIQGQGIRLGQYYGKNQTVAGCLVAKCSEVGISSSSESSGGFIYNNISIGNATNWSAIPSGLVGAGYNCGASGDAPWYTTTDTSIKTLTADNTSFVDYTGNDFRPASESAPQVDAATVILRIEESDIAGNEKPNYNNGGVEALDCGPYEFDHGYGNHPASTTVTFSGVNAGSEIRVYDASGNELAGVESSTANPELTWVLSTGDVRIVVVHLDYKIKDFQYTPISGAVSLPVQQEADSWYSNP